MQKQLGLVYLLPCLLSVQLWHARPVDLATGFAVDSFVARLIAELASSGRTVASSVAFNLANVARAGEGAVDLRVAAVRLVVTDNELVCMLRV